MTALEIAKHLQSFQARPEDRALWEIALQLATLNEQIGKGRLAPILVAPGTGTQG